MQHAVYLPTQGDFADPRLLATLATDAERAGWDGVFIWDELLPIGQLGDGVVDSVVSLAAMATVTERVRLGVLLAPLPRLRPEAFARQMTALDHLSQGRVVIGAGLGNPSEQFTMFGLEGDLKVRASMLDEFLDVLAQLWSGETVHHHGQHYRVDGVRLVPTPVQRPRVPIWIGADSRNRAPWRRAARWDGYAPASTSWPDEVIPVQDYAEALADIRGVRADPDAPYDVVLIGDATGRPPADLAEYEALGVTWLLTQAFTADEARVRITAGPPI